MSWGLLCGAEAVRVGGKAGTLARRHEVTDVGAMGGQIWRKGTAKYALVVTCVMRRRLMWT